MEAEHQLSIPASTEIFLLAQFPRTRAAQETLQAATSSYLKHLIQRFQYLNLRGMGISDRIPLRLPLVEMYVPLKARIELPEGETWARQLKLAGRQVSDEEAETMGPRLSEPQPVLDLLRANDGLIILGDPGAGKTTFLKYLALILAQGENETLGIGPAAARSAAALRLCQCPGRSRYPLVCVPGQLLPGAGD